MKRFVNPLLIALVVFSSFFASQKLLNSKFYTSHDGEGHVIRMIEFDEALRDGQFPVRLAKRINYGLSYPFFNFNYPLVYYLGEVFHFFGLSFVSSFKTIMILSVILGSVALYFLTLPYFNKIGAFITAIFFIFAPYKFLNMYVRANVAESLGLALIPVLLLAIDRFIKNRLSVVALSLVMALLILSHNISAMIGLPLGVVFFITRSSRAGVKKFTLSLLLSFLMTAFFWVPLVVETRLTRLSELSTDYQYFFPTFKEIIYSPWGFGAFKQGIFPGKMSPQIGVIHELAFVLAIIGFVFRKNKFVLFFIVLGIFSIFLSLPVSKLLWDKLSFLKMVQLPWRFIGYTTLAFSVTAGFFISILPKYLKILFVSLFICLLLYGNRNHIRVNQYVDFVNPFLSSEVYGPSTTSKNEHLPLWSPHIFKEVNPEGDFVPTGIGNSERLVWKSNYHQFKLQTDKDGLFLDNTIYYPGWSAKIDGKTTPINYLHNGLGRLSVDVSAGEHTIEFSFNETRYRLFADIVSLVFFTGSLIFVILRGVLPRR